VASSPFAQPAHPESARGQANGVLPAWPSAVLDAPVRTGTAPATTAAPATTPASTAAPVSASPAGGAAPGSTAPTSGVPDQILWPSQPDRVGPPSPSQAGSTYGGGQAGAAGAGNPYSPGAYTGQPAQTPSRSGGTVYGRGAAAPGAHHAPGAQHAPSTPSTPENAPGLRNVGGPVGSGLNNPSQAYYPGQHAPQFPPPNPLENSGSLTGHILSRGRADTPTPKSRTARVVIIMIVVLAVVVGLGFLAATVFNDFLSDLLGGFTE
jgi:hypothetical protein